MAMRLAARGSSLLLAKPAHKAAASRRVVRVFSQRSVSDSPAGDALSVNAHRRAIVLTAPVVFAAASFATDARAEGELKTADSGLQYIDTVVGTGPEPAKGAKIKAHYEGRLTDGKVFDSSYARRQPLGFQVGVGQVIKGWDEGILGGPGIPPMKEGGKRQLVIPPGLGYGARGAGGVIPPNATLVFDVELVAAK